MTRNFIIHFAAAFLLLRSALAQAKDTSAIEIDTASRVYQRLVDTQDQNASANIPERKIEIAGDLNRGDSAVQAGAIRGLLQYLNGRRSNFLQPPRLSEDRAISIVFERFNPGFSACLNACRKEIRSGDFGLIFVSIEVLDSQLVSALKEKQLDGLLSQFFRQDNRLLEEPSDAEEMFWIELFRFFPSQTVAAMCSVQSEKGVNAELADRTAEVLAACKDLHSSDWIGKDREKMSTRVSRLLDDPRWFVRAFAVRCMGLQPQVENEYPLRNQAKLAISKSDESRMVRKIADLASVGSLKSTR